jgi:hypothetical protein
VEPWQLALLQTLNAALSAAAALSGVFLAQQMTRGRELDRARLDHELASERELSKTRRTDRLQAYRELMGLGYVYQQAHGNVLQAKLYIVFYHLLGELTGRGETSVEFEEYRYWSRQQLVYIDELTRVSQKVFEVLGSVGVLFADDPEVGALIESVYPLGSILDVGLPPAAVRDAGELEHWKNQRLSDLAALAADRYGLPVSKLVRHLKPLVERGV